MTSPSKSLSHTLHTWLSRINQPVEWLHPKLGELSDPSLILDRDVVIRRLCEAIRSGELICLVGDYDSDGSGAAALLADCLQQCGGRVQVVLCSRFTGGYGLSDQVADKLLATGAKLLVTLDCGSSDHDRLQRLKDNGVESLVIDHHLVPDRKLPVTGFLNPWQAGCNSTFKHYSSGALAWSVAVGILTELGLRDTIDHAQWFDIAAMTLISDVMPLIGDNRSLTRAGLSTISQGKRPGIRALLEIAKVAVGTQISARDIGFKIAPAVNAPGRLGSPDIIVRLLLEKDLGEARKIAQEVKTIWDERRTITDQITEEAIKEVEERGWSNAPSLVLGRESWGHGIVGISAARLVDKYKVPVACIGSEGRGSLRGPAGSRLHDALAYCAPHLGRWGGHQAAAGCHVDFNSLDDFRQAFRAFHEINPIQPPEGNSDLYLDLDLRDTLEQVEKDLYLLEPTGQGNPKPIIRVQGLITGGKEVKGGHGKFDLKLDNRRTLPCFIISRGAEIEEWIGQRATVTGDLRKNEWRGKTTIEMFVENVVVSQ